MLLLQTGVEGDKIPTWQLRGVKRQDSVCHSGLGYAGNVLFVGEGATTIALNVKGNLCA
jgi:hypothetical protein